MDRGTHASPLLLYRRGDGLSRREVAFAVLAPTQTKERGGEQRAGKEGDTRRASLEDAGYEGLGARWLGAVTG